MALIVLSIIMNRFCDHLIPKFFKRKKCVSKPPAEPLIECLVCSDKFKFEEEKIIYCNSNACDNVEEDGPSSSGQIHPFCHDCILGLASAAVGEIPLAKGGIGLRCMMGGCDNPILYSEIYKLLPTTIQNKLEERMFEESIGMALLVNLERCKNCNFAIELEMDKKINKVFDCIACNAQFCRICERDWDDEHIGLRCEEMDKKDKKEREIEKKLNEAIVRKCPRCGVQFVKEKGCNRMTCRCGMTQCYICREREIEYNHFCQHFRDPNNPTCKECNKKCLLHEDTTKKDEQLIKEIRQKEGAKA